MMLFSVSAASPARRPALPDQAIAVVEKEGLDLRLDLAQRGDDVLRLFATHEDGLGLDDVGIVAVNSGFFHNSTKAVRISATASGGVFGGIKAVRNIPTSGSLDARSTS